MEHNFATKDDFNGIQSQLTKARVELKHEITEVRNELRNEISELRAELRHGLQSLEYKMTIKVGLMQAASVGLLGALIKFF